MISKKKWIVDVCLGLLCWIQVTIYNDQENAKQQRLDSRSCFEKKKWGKCCVIMLNYTANIYHSYWVNKTLTGQ